jgi:hypothetical protein
MRDDLRHQIESEFEQAEVARSFGKEGRARVCCRRAAGIAIREYFAQRGLSFPGKSSIDLIKILSDMEEIPPDIKKICNHLTLRVSEDFTIPVGVDLLVETRLLCISLMPDWNPKSSN